MATRKVIDVLEGEWLEWKRRERWVCCDCSLVHRVEWRTFEGKLQVRMYRENRSTAAYRREHKIAVTNGTGRNTSRSKRK